MRPTWDEILNLPGGVARGWSSRWTAARGKASHAFQDLKEHPLAVFIGEWLRSPRRMGAVCPSGSALAEAMAAAVRDSDGLVVELGPGTGCVTAALLRQGIAPQNIVAVEQSAAMSDLLKRLFPEITVINGDAGQLSDLLSGQRAASIVSSIPLMSLPQAECERIVREMKKLAPPEGGRLVQFSYFWGGSYLAKSGLSPLHSQLVIKNFPPARVTTFSLPRA